MVITVRLYQRAQGSSYRLPAFVARGPHGRTIRGTPTLSPTISVTGLGTNMTAPIAFLASLNTSTIHQCGYSLIVPSKVAGITSSCQLRRGQAASAGGERGADVVVGRASPHKAEHGIFAQTQ